MTSSSTADRDAITASLFDIVAEEAMVDRSAIRPEALLEELGVKSADFVMILMAVEEKFGVYLSVDEELAEAKTVRDLTDIVVTRIQEHRARAGA
ncbi:phosphopantetheine-binding protein [Alsobacter soli]|uniref:Phosphopantetheine-binding protein n=1 Tax=Alsobacter soli TaxID=2109933 RepID=A0A2T1HY36_9HYPH|nr:phosphopantetheine-binding protein [Alsobacter soli]PSC06500.1 phosphopantetheine-binding protein [Alsobacter soli]